VGNGVVLPVICRRRQIAGITLCGGWTALKSPEGCNRMPIVFQPVGLTARVQMIFSQAGKNVENVWHVTRAAIPFVAPDLGAIAAVYASWYGTYLRNFQPTGCSFVKLVLTDLTASTSPQLEYVSGLPLAGTGSGAELPMNATVAVRINTALRGRSYRGRIFHVGLMENQVVGSFIGSSFLAPLVSCYTQLNTQLQAAGYELSVVSYVSAKVRRAAGLATLVSSITIDGGVDSQRRRLPDG
jgi:hypothetical protein